MSRYFFIKFLHFLLMKKESICQIWIFAIDYNKFIAFNCVFVIVICIFKKFECKLRVICIMIKFLGTNFVY